MNEGGLQVSEMWEACRRTGTKGVSLNGAVHVGYNPHHAYITGTRLDLHTLHQVRQHPSIWISFTSATHHTMEEVKVTFKKRSAKVVNVRKKDVNEDDVEPGDEVSSETLQDIKLQQTVRARKTGSSLEALSKPAATASKAVVSDESGKTIESVMGTQYTTQMAYGISTNNIPHKKLMDQYIENKLGLAKPGQ